MNPLLRDVEYAVRGVVPDRAMQIEREIKENPTGHGYPFDKTIQCNIGNPQALGQKPLTFNRQVLSLVSNPDLLAAVETSADKALRGLYKADALRRARHYLDQ